MFNRQFSLLVMATLLLSPTLVEANEIGRDTHLSVGNIQIHNTAIGTKIQTPNIQIGTPKTTENRVLVSRTRRRYRQTAIRRTRTSAPAIFRQRTIIDADEQATIITPSIIRSTPIQSSSNSSQAVNAQRQSIQCSGGGSVVAQTTSTVNGRTIRSESRSNCD
jgi:hypothetical protein